MRTLLTLMAVVMLMAFSSGAALADQSMSGPASKSAAADRLHSPRTTIGELVEWTPGKVVQIKEETGKVHTYGLTKTTKIDGSLQIGRMITVTSTGRWAREITVQEDNLKMRK